VITAAMTYIDVAEDRDPMRVDSKKYAVATARLDVYVAGALSARCI
jgi:hypothetical protein